MSIGTALKRCGLCQQEKSRSEFYRCDRSKDGRQTRCKVCQRRHNNTPRGARIAVDQAPEAKTMAAFDILAAQTAAALG